MDYWKIYVATAFHYIKHTGKDISFLKIVLADQISKDDMREQG